ncbi:MAG: NAD(P)/FAD-dependent oxidoreductase [Bacteroidaceae bacterium]|nr:NAD(P)/FAD-dependent oxidoreductase [Bacteroidaceae bacterium]
MAEERKKRALVVGAGPAGLTAAYELLKKTDIQPVVMEATDVIGGISQTVKYKGNRMDIGGHRFFSKSTAIMEWWNNVMPVQGSPSKDDILLGNSEKPLQKGGPDPQKDDRVMLYRDRVSRIFFLRKFFDYPISLKFSTFANMGLWRTIKSGFGYIYSQMHKLKEDSLENFYINRFGRPLYELFFEGYTEKVWGKHPSKLGADWGSQRVKGLSVYAIIKDALMKPFKGNDVSQKKVETSLIEQFIYPKFGPGQLWEIVADDVRAMGGEVNMLHEVKGINISEGRVVSVDYQTADGAIVNAPCDYLLSTMPIKNLVESIKGTDVPEDVRRIAAELPYRDFITVGLLLDKMKIKNETKIKTYAHRVPDTWIYIQERDVKVGRLQVFNNWSPYLVEDYENRMFVGLEYFCNEGDKLWNMSDDEFISMAIDELVKIDIIDRDAVLDSTRVKIKKAYPAYFGSYYELDKVKNFLDSIENLYCLGRNGQHRYNNMDHSMMTAMVAVDNIKNGVNDKSAVWNVNTETEYHEKK